MKEILQNKLTKMSRDEILDAIYKDTLTGIWNRRAYEDTINTPWLAIIDVDSLKWVNDHSGHRAGDTLLVHVALVLKKMFGDNAFRLSGDEFVVRTEQSEDLRKLDTCDRIYSFGIGRTLDEADTLLQADKTLREAAGRRAERGCAPAYQDTITLLTLGSYKG